VPLGLFLDLDERFRVLADLEDARLEPGSIGAAPGLVAPLPTAVSP
jgi:hypothetical protein